ncbi:hypothetical protein ACH347_33130 [Saccharopolyspora sp. 5N102]|uniref:hypothetical protein n=1 Tax=Saccharopolyspora sp. 5N102 TaxID=3375155 RepID=UPI0037AAB815
MGAVGTQERLDDPGSVQGMPEARPAGVTGDDADLVDYLRTDGLAVVHSGPDWTLDEVSST